MKRKIFATYIVLIVFIVVTIFSIFWIEAYAYIDKKSNEYYIMEAKLLSYILDNEDNEHTNYQSIIDNHEKFKNVRITIIAEDGSVLADSVYDKNKMKNHLMRPEVQDALQGKTVVTKRYSMTNKEQYRYIATPFENEYNKGVIRIGFLEETLEDTKLKVFAVMLATTSAIMVSAIALAMYFSKKISQPIDNITEIAKEIAEGNYNIPVLHAQNTDAKSLAVSINKMRKSLKRNLEKLKDKKMQFSAMLSSMDSAVVAIDKGNLVIFYNKQFVKLFGLYNKKLKNKTIYSLVRNSAVNNVIDRVRKKDSSYSQNGTVGINEVKNIRITGTPLKQENHKKMGVLLIIEDITKIMKLENISNDFVSNVTHELRTPLTSIRGFVETLKNGAIHDQVVSKRFLDIIDIETERLTYLINDILTLSEIESYNDAEKEIVYCDVRKVISEVAEMFQNRLKENVELVLDIHDVREYPLNHNRIKQLLINLIDNAIKNTENGIVKVFCTEEEDNLSIEIEDTGIGISNENLERIFERFYRVDKGRSRKLGGTGLGLSITKHIVELYNGEINVESEVGKGTKFIIKFPYIL